MRRDLSWALRPVAAVILLVAAAVLSMSALVGAPAALADDGAGAEVECLESDPDCEDDSGADGETDEPSPTVSATPTATSSPTNSDVVSIENAIFRWGLNNQSNARSHNPRAFNFFSAGVANPGRGGATVERNQWSPRVGNVEIQRWLGSGKGWKRASWDGWKKTPDGLSVGIDRNFSLHNVVFSRGKGSVDVAAGTAEIAWKGTFTVVYYSGNTLFTVSDPVVEVANGKGRVTAVLGGWNSDRSTMTKWDPVTPQRVSVAEFSSVALQKSGFSATPVYRGVEAVGFKDQVKDGVWGSFPQGMLEFLEPMGMAQFWYSTGLATDHTKVPLPITVSFSAREVPAPAPSSDPAKPAPHVENSVVPAPQGSSGPASAPSTNLGQAAPPAVSASAEASGAALVNVPAAADLSGSSLAAAGRENSPAGGDRLQWLAGTLLLGAAALFLIPLPRRSFD